MPSKADKLFDDMQMAAGSTWGKAVERYLAKGVDPAELDKYREAYRKQMETEKVKTLSSKSKGK